MQEEVFLLTEIESPAIARRKAVAAKPRDVSKLNETATHGSCQRLAELDAAKEKAVVTLNLK